MPRLALVLFSVAVGLGCLAALPLIDAGRRRIAYVAWAHGAVALFALVVLAIAAGGPVHGEAAGVGDFAAIAAALFALAACVGLSLPLVARRFSAALGAVAGLHATVACLAYLLLLAWVALG